MEEPIAEPPLNPAPLEADRGSAETATAAPSRSWPALAAILLAALATRLAVLPLCRESNMSADAAHFLNIARCVARGQGFSNPAAWPAWIQPARLPGPETFKDPGYPYAIAALAPILHDPFRAGQVLSLLAGVLLPLAVWALARRLQGGRSVATLAAFLAAASPLLIAQSVLVLSESLFTLLLVLACLAAAPHVPEAPQHTHAITGPGGAARAMARDLIAGVLIGSCFLVRAQTLLALPALGLLLLAHRRLREGLAGGAAAGAAALLVASPLLLRNVRLFGSPLHSDATAFAVWPFVDPIDFTHRLERPPAPLSFALAHLPMVLAHTSEGLARFVRSALPRDILGHAVWAPALAAGVALGVARWRTWGFAWAYLVPSVLLMSAVSWNTRYFASTAPFWCMLTAAGGVWLARRVLLVRWPLSVRVAGVAAFLGLVALQTHRVARELEGARPAEIEAAMAEAPFLRTRLASDEAVMAVTTSYWSWFSDRPAVHLVITDPLRFGEILRRYRVRWAALPTSRLAELAERFPGRRLPDELLPDHADPTRDVTVFVVRLRTPSAGPPRLDAPPDHPSPPRRSS